MLRRKIINIYHNSRIGGILLKLPKSVYDFYRYRLLSDKAFLISRFEYELGYKLNLNSPKTLNEKIQWMKVYDRNPLYTLCSDKFAVRSYVEEKIGKKYLIPLVMHTNNAADLIPENLPEEPFIIKSTHSSGRNKIVWDKNSEDWNKIRKDAKKWLKENFYYRLREWQYKNIPPAIVVEKLITDENGLIPNDYKFWCFNGKIEYIEAHQNRHSDHKKVLYDKNWNITDFMHARKRGNPVSKPQNFELMKEIVSKLSADFYFVRVDIYEIKGKIYFGELTFSPGSGFQKFDPMEQDRILGDKLKLPIVQ